MFMRCFSAVEISAPKFEVTCRLSSSSCCLTSRVPRWSISQTVTIRVEKLRVRFPPDAVFFLLEYRIFVVEIVETSGEMD